MRKAAVWSGVWGYVLGCVLGGVAGCGPAAPPVQVSPDASPQVETDGPAETEASRRFPAQLVFISTDGAETSIDLQDLEVASVRKEVTEGTPEAFEMTLEFLRHSEGHDVYNFSYTDPGETNASRGSGPHTYDGTETLLKETPHGKFLLRPIP